jgi:hypothetical protein
MAIGGSRVNGLGMRALGGHFTAEKAVGLRNELLILAIIGPSFSVSSRTLIQAGSARNAPQIFSR